MLINHRRFRPSNPRETVRTEMGQQTWAARFRGVGVTRSNIYEINIARGGFESVDQSTELLIRLEICVIVRSCGV